MIWYNVSIHVQPDIEAEWVQWMQQIHLPAMMATGCFERYEFSRLIDPPGDEYSIYVAQYQAVGMEELNRYYELHSADLRADAINRWENKFLIFRSVAEQLV